MSNRTWLLVGMTLVSSACHQSAGPWVDERCGLWLEEASTSIDVELGGGVPRLRWPPLDHPTPRVFSVGLWEHSANSSPFVWQIEGPLPDEVVYGEVPSGATELVAAAPLIPGEAYYALVRVLDFDIGMYCRVFSDRWIAP
jgi:hypothetical protein